MCGKFALGSLLLALFAIAAIGAPVANAADDNCEYCVNIPANAGGDEPSANASGNGDSSSGQPSDTTATTPTDSTATSAGDSAATSAGTPTDSSGSDADSKGDDDKGGAAGGGKAGGGKGPGAEGAGGNPTSAPAVNADPASTSSDGGGGVSVFLIVVALLAVGCIGLAVWQLKRAPGDSDVDVGSKPAEANPGA